MNIPILPACCGAGEATRQQRQLLDSLLAEHAVSNYAAWYYTPMAREFTRHLNPAAVIYDCMDELCAFAGAPSNMRINEQELFEAADLVFTGGVSLFESKRNRHSRVSLFPSSVDTEHFRRARLRQEEPADQAVIPHPRIGYAGVIDERMDLNLIKEAASQRPDWHLVFLGPVVKIDVASLPQAPNIHYLGMKQYADLPAYFSGWKVGMLPFALNESTKFISPTKTPEYLAAGLHVVSSPIRDVVHPYADLGFVGIASGAGEFISVVESFLRAPQKLEFNNRVEQFLSRSSWETTYTEMDRLIKGVTDTPLISSLANAPLNPAFATVGGSANV